MPQVTGKVVRTGPGTYLVDSGGGLWFCELRGRLRSLARDSSELPCIGDIVVLESMTRSERTVAGTAVSGTAVISEVLPRKTRISRLTPPDKSGRHPAEQLLAANVDQGVVVVSLTLPPLKIGTIERYLVLCRQAGIAAVVCLNKSDELDPQQVETLVGLASADAGEDASGSDLCGEPYLAIAARVVRFLRNRKVPLLLTSAVTGSGLEDLRRLLCGKTSVLLGPSGAGKTSILNALKPEFAGKTLPVSEATSKGRHSTTYSSLLRVGDGEVADIPGLRAIGFWNLDDEPVRSEYEDIQELAAGCRFRDCSHTHEPGCAVRQALERGELDESRYRRYLRLMREVKRRNRQR